MAVRRRRKARRRLSSTAPEILAWALHGIEREIALTRDRLAHLTIQARKMRARVGTAAAQVAEPVRKAVAPARKRRRKLTAEGRRRIIEAVKRRWAAQKKAKG
jgi:hypothetical protein